MDVVAYQKEAVTDLVMDSVDFYLKWEWSRTQCGSMAGICVCVCGCCKYMYTHMHCVYNSLTEPRTHTHRFTHMRSRNMHAYTHRIVSVMINGRKVWIAH